MWQQEKKDKTIASLALWLALASTPLTTTVFVSTPTRAESKPDASTFPLPSSVESGTSIRIDGSHSLITINQSLKTNFEQEFSGTKVEVAINGTDAALQALIDGKIDVAAIARELTAAEKAQGLEAISLRREKIAIVVGVSNSFKGSLSNKQLAKVFRGEITDWSELGGKAGKIRIIERPANSDTRNALRGYPPFENAESSTKANIVQLSEDSPAQVVKQLGKDGISYMLAHQVYKLPDVKAVDIEETGTEDAQYPFSQPLVYVYKQNPSPNVSAFLGFVLAQAGQNAVEEARNAEASAIAISALQSFTEQTTATPITANNVNTTPLTSSSVNVPTQVNSTSQATPESENNAIAAGNMPWLMLLPLFAIAGLGVALPWWLRGKKPSSQAAENTGTSPANQNSDPSLEISPVEEKAGDRLTLVQENTNTVAINATDNLAINDEDTKSNIAVLTAKKTDTVVESTNNLETNAEVIATENTEVVWDIEAPIAVVNNPYPQIPNRPEMTFDIELPTDEFIGPATELTDELVEESMSELTTNKLSSDDEINSFSELLNSTIETSEESLSLSELLDASVKPSTEDNLSLSELLDASVKPSTEESLSELLKASAQEPPQDSLSLSELLEATAKPSTEDSLSLSELLEATAKPSTEEASTSLSDLLNTSTETNEFLDTSEETLLSEETEELMLTTDELEDSLLDVSDDNELEDSLSDISDNSTELPEELGQVLDHLVDNSPTAFSEETETEEVNNLLANLPDNSTTELEDSLPELPEELGQVLDSLASDYSMAFLGLPDTSTEEETETVNDLLLDLPEETETETVNDLLLDLPEETETEAVNDLLLDLPEETEIESVEIEATDDLLLDLPEETESVEIEATDDLLLDLPEETETESVNDLLIDLPEETEAEAVNDLLLDLPEETEAVNDLLLDLPEETETVNDLLIDLPEETETVNDLLLDLSEETETVNDLLIDLPEETETESVEIEATDDLLLDLPEETETEAVDDLLLDLPEETETVEIEATDDLLLDLPEETETEAVDDLLLDLPEETETESVEIEAADDLLLDLSEEEGLSVEITAEESQILTTSSNISEITNEDLAENVDNEFIAETNVEENPLLTDIDTTEWLDIEDGRSNIVLTPRTSKWACVSWYVSDHVKEVIRNKGGHLAVRLYDVTGLDLSYQLPQLIQQYECEEGTSDRYISVPTGNRNYISEIGCFTKNGSWLCLSRSGVIRVFDRIYTDLWLDTDTELVIHGATKPGATVTVSGNNIPLKDDGTFELHIPLLNDAVEYELTATAPTTGQTKTIVKKFSQESR
ncbi:MAG TPA: substrate-binding domain-containing protein [Nostocaceae cyanobacterium]|nr:substrate-binding domain-containing protein [Nostocaceae cyanobacterium]